MKLVLPHFIAEHIYIAQSVIIPSGSAAMAGTVIQGSRPKTPSAVHDATKIAASIYLAKSSTATSTVQRKTSARQPSPAFGSRPGPAPESSNIPRCVARRLL